MKLDPASRIDQAIALATKLVTGVESGHPDVASMSYEAFCAFGGHRLSEVVPPGTFVHFVGYEWHLDYECDEECPLR